MLFQSPGFWNTAIDGIQIFLCLLILIFLVKIRKNNKRSLQQGTIDSPGNDFNTQIFTQTFKQHADQAFANIIEAISAEQRRLENFLLYEQGQKQVPGTSEPKLQSKSPASHEIFGLTEAVVKDDNRHEEILNLSHKGKSVREISEALKTPIDEVELVLSLNQNERT